MRAHDRRRRSTWPPVATTEQLAALQRECRTRLRRPVADAVRGAAGRGHARPGTLRHDRHRALHHVRRQPARPINLIDGARALAFVRGRDYVAARGRDRPRARRDAPPHRPVLRGAVRRACTTPDADPPEGCMQQRSRAARASRSRVMSAVAARAPESVLRRGWTGRSSAAWTACCRATTARCSAASAWTWPTCASTSSTTTCATSTGTSPRGCRRRYVRLFIEDREITAWFLLDLSPSVDFGSGDAAQARRLGRVRRACSRACSRATATASARCSTATASTR